MTTTINRVNSLTNIDPEASGVPGISNLVLSIPDAVQTYSSFFTAIINKDKERIMDAGARSASMPFSFAYAPLAILAYLRHINDFFRIFTYPTLAIGMAASLCESVYETVGLKRQVVLLGRLDLNRPQETIDLLQSKYLQTAQGKEHLIQRIGKKTVENIENRTMDPLELVKEIRLQAIKKLVIHTVGLISLAIALFGFAMSFHFAALGLIITVAAMGIILGLVRYAMKRGWFPVTGMHFAMGNLFPAWMQTAYDKISGLSKRSLMFKSS